MTESFHEQSWTLSWNHLIISTLVVNNSLTFYLKAQAERFCRKKDRKQLDLRLNRLIFSPQHVWVDCSVACGNSIDGDENFICSHVSNDSLTFYCQLSYQWNCCETKILPAFSHCWEDIVDFLCSKGIASSWINIIMEAFTSNAKKQEGKKKISIRQIQFMIVNKQKFC